MGESILPARGSVFAARLKPLTALGRISFGLYVVHEFVLMQVNYGMGRLRNAPVGFLVYWALGSFCTVALVWGSCWYLESPFLLLKKRFTQVLSRPL